MTIDLQEMTTPDKLRLMEALWQDRSAGGPARESPEWHGDVLAERDRLANSEEGRLIDWETAKRYPREKLQGKYLSNRFADDSESLKTDEFPPSPGGRFRLGSLGHLKESAAWALVFDL